MSVNEVEHAQLLLENSKLKLTLVETQMQFLNSQHVLIKQEIEKFENELSIVQSKDEQPK